MICIICSYSHHSLIRNLLFVVIRIIRIIRIFVFKKMNEEYPNISMEAPRKPFLNDFFKKILTFLSELSPKHKKRNIICLIIGLFFLLFYIIFWTAPSDFPVGSIYDLKVGQTLSMVSNNFAKSHIIKSNFWFKSFVYIFSLGKTIIIEGDYSFYEKQNVLTVAWRVSHGKLEIVPVKITIPEGLNSFEIANILSENFPSFDKNIFLKLIVKEKFEGYLFPDTYFIMPNMTEKEIIKIMNDNFNEKIQEASGDIKKFGKSEDEVIKMASIIEEEARTEETRKIIAGILWKRFSIGMALQVDSSFKYINGKITATLSTEDLKIDSPYKSYTRRGLPPTAISNPGLGAIKATINPIKTPYWYFLTDKEGNMHYAVTFEEHLANKLKYLK